ncbi:hypothetical protein V3C99_000995, partial [Haemonchus contortus]
DLSKARFVKVYDYLEERAAQVADLLQVVDNSNLVSGEVTKGPRTAAQRLPRHMRRRAMAYDVRRFPKGLRNYAAPFLANTKHRKKPPSRYFRRRSRILLLNYIRRQRKMVWLETHIWHAKRFHIVDRWGYRLPDRSFQRNFRPCYRDSVRHCTVRDKSYLSCILISHSKQDELIAMLSPLCVNSASPTFAFKSGLDGRYEVSTLIHHPGQYPRGLIGPARFLWSKEGELHRLSIWIHPSCRDQLLDLLKELLQLSDEEQSEDDDDEKSITVPHTVEEWRLSRLRVHTHNWTGKHGIEVQDLRDQLVRIRLYGPLSVSIVSDALKLVDDEKAYQFRLNHSEWRDSVSKLSTGCVADGTIFSLLVEDPRISRPRVRKVPVVECPISTPESYSIPQSIFWSRDVRLRALSNRMTDSELNSLKGKCLSQIKETEAKIPVLVVFRSGGSGRGDTLSG